MIKVLEMFGEPISYGGQESVVYNMLSSFKLGKDFIIDLFTPYFANNKELISLVKDNGGKVYDIGINFKTNDNRFKLKTPIKQYFIENKFNDKYDVVHIHTGSLTTMLVYAKIAKEFGAKKVIVHSHIANLHDNFLKKIYKSIICKQLDKYVDCYLGCSREAIETKFTKNINNKAIVINNGIDIDKFKFNEKNREDIRNKYNINDKFIIGSLGRIDEQKNNLFMIDILNEIKKVLKNNSFDCNKNDNNTDSVNCDFCENNNCQYNKKNINKNESKPYIDQSNIYIKNSDNNYKNYNKFNNIFNNIKLMMVGDGKLLEKCKSYANELGLNDDIIFAGNVTDSYRYYSVFDVFIMPSLFEGLGITAIEAQVSGLPCLLSDTMPRLTNISSGTTYLPIQDKDYVKIWAGKILEVYENGVWKNGRDLFDIDYDKFDKTKTFKIVEDIYEKK